MNDTMRDNLSIMTSCLTFAENLMRIFDENVEQNTVGGLTCPLSQTGLGRTCPEWHYRRHCACVYCLHVIKLKN